MSGLTSMSSPRRAVLTVVVAVAGVVFLRGAQGESKVNWNRKERQLLDKERAYAFQRLAVELRRRLPLDARRAEALRRRLDAWPDAERMVTEEWTERLLRGEPVPLLEYARGVSFEGMALDAEHLEALFERSEFAKLVAAGKLTRLDFTDNWLRVEGVRRLAAFEHVGELTHLVLAQNDIGTEGAEVIAGADSLGNLVELDLADNGIGPKGVVALAKSSHLGSLKRLNLGDNSVGDEGAKALAEATFTQNLEELGLGDAGVGASGKRALRDAGEQVCTAVRGLDLECPSEQSAKNPKQKKVRKAQKSVIGALKPKKGGDDGVQLKSAGGNASIEEAFSDSGDAVTKKKVVKKKKKGTADPGGSSGDEASAPSVEFGELSKVGGEGSLRPDAVGEVSEGRAPANLEGCYRQYVEQGGQKTGEVVLEYAISEEGRASGVETVRSEMDDEVIGCLVATVLSLEFPPPEGDAVQVRQRFEFRPVDEK